MSDVYWMGTLPLETSSTSRTERIKFVTMLELCKSGLLCSIITSAIYTLMFRTHYFSHHLHGVNVINYRAVINSPQVPITAG